MTLNVSFHVCPCSHLYRTLFLPHCLFFVCVYVCFLMMIKIPSLVVGCVNSALGGWAQSTSPSLSLLSQTPLPRSCMYTCVLCIRIDNLDLQIFHTHTHTRKLTQFLCFLLFFFSVLACCYSLWFTTFLLQFLLLASLLGALVRPPYNISNNNSDNTRKK